MSIADSMGAVNTSNQDQNQKTDRILRALAQDTGRPNQQNNMNKTIKLGSWEAEKAFWQAVKATKSTRAQDIVAYWKANGIKLV